MNLETLKYIKNDPKRLFSMLGSKGLLNWMPDEAYVKLQFRLAMGYPLDLKNPKTFNEKLQWLKLHDRNPLYTTLVDKYAVRQYIGETLGEEYLIPLVGGPWKNAEEIDFDALPEQFVLKCNHDSGGVIVCKDKSMLDIDAARKKLNERLKKNYYYANREWPYKNVKPCILAEKYMADEKGELEDYKFFCFHGEPKLLYVCTERNTEKGLHTTYFDLNWEKLPIRRDFPISDEEIKKPACFDEMIEVAKKLAAVSPYVRIDLYDIQGKPRFGEFTLYPDSGMRFIDPPEWNERMGSWIVLPE